MAVYRDDRYEWDESKSNDRRVRSGFDFRAAVRIFDSDRYVERWDAAHGSSGEERIIATGAIGVHFVSVVYTVRGERKRIISAFEADDDDILDYMETYAGKEE